jgi:hypothetical protein
MSLLKEVGNEVPAKSTGSATYKNEFRFHRSQSELLSEFSTGIRSRRFQKRGVA